MGQGPHTGAAGAGHSASEEHYKFNHIDIQWHYPPMGLTGRICTVVGRLAPATRQVTAPRAQS